MSQVYMGWAMVEIMETCHCMTAVVQIMLPEQQCERHVPLYPATPFAHNHACRARQGLTHCSACPGISCTISCDGGSPFPGSISRQLCSGPSAQWGAAGWTLPASLHSCGFWVGICHVTAAGALR